MCKKNIFIIFIEIFFFCNFLNAQEAYYNAFNEFSRMLGGEQILDFKRAVFITENACYDNQFEYEDFCRTVMIDAFICKSIMGVFDITYPEKDKNKTMVYASVFKYMTDTIPIRLNDTTTLRHFPFQYNFEDFAGEKDWSNMFVTKLLKTGKGNCHSLPILYKLIAEEMGERAWLSFAPNHLYIKLRNEQSGWYNTELTSGNFPTDAWLIASGYIHLDAVRNGVYMDTLSQIQSVAMCLIDLAEGFQKKHGDINPGFVLSCCETALKYYPNYVNALLLQAETLMKAYRNQPDKDSSESRELFERLNSMYAHIHKLGYRKMPDRMYLEWLMSLKEQKEYQNQSILSR
ncbi:MAG: hypothetical protein LBL13_09680 [Bacteroidales bacterium]|nr:hypothetical protein [Bacteroidales bacterium]